MATWLDRHRPFSDTAVAREVSWLVTTELLQFPCAQPHRTSTEDALAEAILSDPRVARRICIGDALPAEARAHIATAISGYAGTRSATAEIATGSITAGIGALWVKHATPGMVTLGSVVANMLAQQAAIAAFPLGAGLGAWWYGMYPVALKRRAVGHNHRRVCRGRGPVRGLLRHCDRSAPASYRPPSASPAPAHRRARRRPMRRRRGLFSAARPLRRSADRSSRPFSSLAAYRTRVILCGPQPP